MDGESIGSVVFFVVFLGALLYFSISVVRHGGFKGAMFGASIDQTLGEVGSGANSMISQKLRVHALAASSRPDKAVGIELSSSTFASWSMTGLTLSTSETRNPIALLERAIAE